jgi:hypothetical protein
MMIIDAPTSGRINVSMIADDGVIDGVVGADQCVRPH